MSLLVNNPNKLEAFRRGDRSVLEELYLTCADEVAMLVRRGFHYNRNGRAFTVIGVNDEQTQCDLVQESFVKAFSDKARQAYNNQYPFRLYLLRITKNLMIDRLRINNRETVVSDNSRNGVGDIDDVLDRKMAFKPENPAILAHRARQQQAVSEFVSSLDDLSMQFYQKRYVLGFSQEKSANVLQITRRKVRTLEKRICKGLRRHLKHLGLWP